MMISRPFSSSLVQQVVPAVPQAPPDPVFPPLQGPGDGAAVHAQPLGDLPHVQLLAVVEVYDFPLAGGDLLPQRQGQLVLQGLMGLVGLV